MERAGRETACARVDGEIVGDVIPTWRMLFHTERHRWHVIVAVSRKVCGSAGARVRGGVGGRAANVGNNNVKTKKVTR